MEPSSIDKTATTGWTDDLLEAPHETPDKAKRVRHMFNNIAPRYELINALFSFGSDARWRRAAVKLAEAGPNDLVLDLATGTGDLARTFFAAGVSRVVGCDFAHEMLVRAAGRTSGPSMWCEGDALHIPFQNDSFSIVSCAFGVRNFQCLDSGLNEVRRVLAPGGRLVVLEFSEPGNRLIRTLHRFYCGKFMPTAAAVISGDRTGAYKYLPKSVSDFPSGEAFCRRLSESGFVRVKATPLTMGVVTVYVAWQD